MAELETSQVTEPQETDTTISVGTTSISSEDVTSTTPDDFNTNYRTYLPEDLRKEKYFETIPDFQTLAKNYVNAQKHIASTRGLTLPQADATDEDWQKFHQATGAYDEPGKYTVELPEIQDFTWNDGIKDHFKALAHSANLTQRQTTKMLEGYAKIVEQGLQAQREAQAELRAQQVEEADRLESQLKQEWGSPRLYERNIRRIDTMLNTIMSPEDYQSLQDAGIGRHPAFLRMMARLAAHHVEDSAIENAQSGKIMSKDEARARQSELRKDPAFLDPRNRDHKRVQQEYLELTTYTEPAQPLQPQQSYSFTV